MTIAAKPLPDLPPLGFDLIHTNKTNFTQVDTDSRAIPNPRNSTEYFILYNFTVPLDVDAVEFGRFEFQLPGDFDFVQPRLYEPIIVVFPGEAYVMCTVVCSSKVWGFFVLHQMVH